MLRTIDLEQLMQKVDSWGWGMASLDPHLANLLLERFHEVQTHGLLQSATITTYSEQAKAIRNDLTYWLEKEHHPTEQKALEGLDQVLQSLKKYFRISLTHLECHFAFYPPGHFYKKHIDQTKDNNKRFFSFVIYLNPDWKITDGGKLVGYSEERKLFEVMPLFGEMIIFRSDIPHEVETSFSERRSIAGWFRV
ncbi:MAG: 2OG-Fe(II) oxygenase [Bdellovibrionota bacterium]